MVLTWIKKPSNLKEYSKEGLDKVESIHLLKITPIKNTDEKQITRSINNIELQEIKEKIIELNTNEKTPIIL